jgi:hypothetical protein
MKKNKQRKKGKKMAEKWFVNEVVSKYRNHKFVVRLMRMGHRCGYVQVNDLAVFRKLEKIYNEEFSIPQINAHGGITFVKLDASKNYLPLNKWIGFDCNHLDDLPDKVATKQNFTLSYHASYFCYWLSFFGISVFWRFDLSYYKG